jgi:hypothetical protein
MLHSRESPRHMLGGYRGSDWIWWFFFFAVGLAWAMYPARDVRWHIRRHHWIADEPQIVGMVRILGVVFMAFAAAMVLVDVRLSR